MPINLSKVMFMFVINWNAWRRHIREKAFGKLIGRLKNMGEKINHKRLFRVYQQMGLSLRRKVKKRLPARVKEKLVQPQNLNDTWCIDFVSDVLAANGRKFRCVNVIDDYNREILFIETDYSIKSSRYGYSIIW